nr:hypothetical protein [Cytophagales bacterium]
MEALRFDRKRKRVKQCPCGKSNRDGKFVPYEEFDDKGYCHSCGETFLPKIEAKEGVLEKWFVPLPPKPITFIDQKIMHASLKGYTRNNFVTFLERKFGKRKAMEAVELYKIGTSKHWAGSTIFWQIDENDQVRSGKIMVYDPSNGKRQPKNTWVHSILKLEGFNLNQCLFGSHLLRYGSVKKVAIVESEKTAIIASILKPEFIWLATGGKGGLRSDRCSILAQRSVFLFPDLTRLGDKTNCFELWSENAEELTKEIPDTTFHVSDYLETNATEEERNMGLDIADYFLKWDWVNEKSEENDGSEKTFIAEHKALCKKNDCVKKTTISEQNQHVRIISFDEYVKGLRFEREILITPENYPAMWDTGNRTSYIDQKTKQFIKMADRNPNLLTMREKFDL